jgi:hypothetical protein
VPETKQVQESKCSSTHQPTAELFDLMPSGKRKNYQAMKHLNAASHSNTFPRLQLLQSACA